MARRRSQPAGTLRRVSVPVQRTRRRQQREETRRQILDAAQAFLRERSYRELTVDALMSTTGHSRTVFYRHFDDVPSLVLTLISDVGTEIVDLSVAWAETGRATPAQAREKLAALVDFHVRYGPIVRAVAEAARHDPDVAQAYDGMVDGFISLTAGALQERAASGKLDLEHPEHVARALIRMLNGYLHDTLGQVPQADRDVVLDTVALIWTRTLFPGQS
jgi:AcrR family transcriptional regulator